MASVSSRRESRVAQAREMCCLRSGSRGHLFGRVQICTFAAVLLFFVFNSHAAFAAPVPTWTTSCTSGDVNYNLCLNSNERLEYIASELSIIDDNTVDQSSQSKAQWEGSWAAVGLLLVLIISTQWQRAWKFLS